MLAPPTESVVADSNCFCSCCMARNDDLFLRLLLLVVGVFDVDGLFQHCVDSCLKNSF